MTNTTVFSGKRIVLGVTGSIAAYKAAHLASQLTQLGAEVDVIVTESGKKFVTPITFQAVTGRKVYSEENLWGTDSHVLHIGLASSADLIIIAPATANTLAKLANGLADNLLTITVLAAACPMFIAPAMDGGMYEHWATQNNIKLLEERGTEIIGPESGHLASGLKSVGRMTEPDEIIARLQYELSRHGPLSGKKILVTAGGTRERIDPVRMLTNRSSGKQGYAIAQAALDLGADVNLVTTTTCLDAPYGVSAMHVETAEDMRIAVMDNIASSDVLIMAAAVADFRPKTVETRKIKKQKGEVELFLEPTIDILEEVKKFRANQDTQIYVVGFAAETDNIIENARQKLENKALDLIVTNDISSDSSGFEVDINKVTVLFSSGEIKELPLMKKNEIARELIKIIASQLSQTQE